ALLRRRDDRKGREMLKKPVRDLEMAGDPYEVFRLAIADALHELGSNDGPLAQVSTTYVGRKQTNVHAVCRRAVDDDATRAEIFSALTGPLMRHPWRFVDVRVNGCGRAVVYVYIEARACGKRPVATVTIEPA
ncbi:MAG: hypothetical protein ABFD84_11110, partial [Candidatus Polarisedimenticolia bacterium]